MKCMFFNLTKGTKVGFIVILISAISSYSMAAEIGIGISVNECNNAIFLPIKITDKLKTEFLFRFGTDEEKSTLRERKYDTLLAGIGLFLLQEVHDKTILYYGCRVLYIDSNYKVNETDEDGYSDKSNGYGIMPTLGFEYYFTDHISLGGEVGYFYNSIDEEYDGTTDVETTSTGTECLAILRFYF